MSHEGIHAIEQIRDLAIYLQRYFQHELTGETTVEIAIRLLNKIRLQKPEVTEEFVESLGHELYGLPRYDMVINRLTKRLKEAGLEVVKE